MATTLLLDRDQWDLCLTSGGDMAVASEPYSQAQDIASECRLILGEAYYETTRGVPYFTEILGRFQPVQIIKEALANAAQLVPGVSGATVYLDTLANREIGGQIQFESIAGGGVTTL